ncbi:MAG: hypothetical protein IIA61_08795 [Candidatus Marinimicrobia bacterium]|nr:hypothetical protein [Candidatus Neomarinimicrobiota bacterium]
MAEKKVKGKWEIGGGEVVEEWRDEIFGNTMDLAAVYPLIPYTLYPVLNQQYERGHSR